jgi:hypothetical protein
MSDRQTQADRPMAGLREWCDLNDIAINDSDRGVPHEPPSTGSDFAGGRKTGWFRCEQSKTSDRVMARHSR